MLLATGVLATACGAGGAPAPLRSVPACTAAAVQAIEHRITLTTIPAACRGLSRAELNFALGRAIYAVAGAGQHKPAWRRRAAVAGARLAPLIESQRRHPAAARPHSGPPPPPPAAPAGRWAPGLAALAAWLLTVGSGAFMLAGWIRHGGLRARDGRNRPGPAVALGHFGVASAGLLAWIAYLATGWAGLAWLAVGVLLAAIGLGMATLTVWTARASGGRRSPSPQAAGLPPGTPAPPRRPPAGRRVIIPIVHGLTASATILLALLTVVSAR
ncbi:MAG: hypothetical protein QOG05_380 [Streptosporangiaceae bacterium]|nr:hypothetical protein [Streptosporangiaceae bacterium]